MEIRAPPEDIKDDAHHIRGLTHPGHYMIAATALYKRRGRLTATVRSDWVERLFVLTESAVRRTRRCPRTCRPPEPVRPGRSCGSTSAAASSRGANRCRL
jgi:hypothetical protein